VLDVSFSSPNEATGEVQPIYWCWDASSTKTYILVEPCLLHQYSIGAKQAKNGKSVSIINRHNAAMLAAPIMAMLDFFLYILYGH
jgi:hypothetical protein